MEENIQTSRDVERSLQCSIRDGVAYSVMTGGAEAYLSAFALYLSASTAQIGWLVALPPLIGSLAQPLSAWLGRRTGGRRPIILFGARMQALAWIGLGLTGLGVSIGLLSLFSVEPAPLLLILPLVFGIGFSLALVIVSARVVLQERPPAEKRGRVIAAQLALANAMAVLPLLLGGSMADNLGIRPVMGLLGVIALGAGIAGLYYARGRERNEEAG